MEDLDEDRPSIVYKFRDWQSKHGKDLLTQNLVYMSSPEEFNDPFDCSISANLRMLNVPEKQEQFANLMTNGMNDATPSERALKDSVRSEVLKMIREKPEKMQQILDQKMTEAVSSFFGIFSLSSHWDNILMWSHYAKNHSGICIGFNEAQISKSALFDAKGLVQYPDDYPTLHPLMDRANIDWYIAQTYTKAKNWSYEKEYRVLRSYSKPATTEDREIIIPDELYTEVILGLDFPDSEVNSILDLVKAKNIPLYKTYKKDYQFAIARTRIY